MKLERKLTWLTLGLFAMVLALAGAALAKEWDQITTFPWRFKAGYLALTVLFHSLALGVTYLVWHLMITRLGGFSNAGLNFRFYYLSTLAKRIPSSIWYIGGRVVMYKQVQVSGSAVLNCILLENAIIGTAGVFTFLVFLPLYSHVPRQVAGPIALLGAGLVISLLARPQLFIEVTNRILKRFGKRGLDQVPARRDILLWGGLYVLPWLFAGAALYCATRAFSDNVGPGIIDAIGISTLAMLVALLNVFFPGGLGLKELTSGALLSYWMPFSTALIISIAYRLIQTFNEMLWAASTLFANRSVSH